MIGGAVLVFGDDTRSFLATVRSLGRRGITVHAAPANFRSPALRSRYIAAVHDLPPWMDEGVDWLSATEALLRSTAFDLVIPCDETAMLPLQRYREQLAPLARLAIPDDRQIALLFDKHETRELARRVGVAVAAGRLTRPDDTAEAVLAEFGAPVVVKPRHSYSLRTLSTRGKVRVVEDAPQLRQLLQDGNPGEIVVERFFVGQGMGISLLSSGGRVLQAFEHHRVRENAGASFYRISAPLSPDLMRACEAIVAEVQYSGVAMFEFKRNTCNNWVLLEINARPWGSMPLPVALGVDFPFRWYRLLTGGEEIPPVPYRTGVYGRNLLPDLRASIAEIGARRLSVPAAAWFVTRRAVELLRPLWGREVQDLFVRDDPLPGLSEFTEIAVAVRHRVTRLIPGAVARRRRRASRRVRETLRKSPEKPFILFVCLGNICRSPFAEALLRARLGENAIRISAAGVIPAQGRRPPDLALQAAAAHGIDLSAHRSAWLTREMAETASLLIVFDDATRGALLDRYPDLRAPLVALGDLAGLDSIADPIDGDAAKFYRVYEQIDAGITALVGAISKHYPQS